MFDEFSLNSYIEFTKDFYQKSKFCQAETQKYPQFKEILNHFLCVIGYYIDGEDRDRLENGFIAIIPKKEPVELNGHSDKADFREVVKALAAEATKYRKTDKSDDLSCFDYRIIDFLNRKPDKTMVHKHFQYYFETAPRFLSMSVSRALLLDLTLMMEKKA